MPLIQVFIATYNRPTLVFNAIKSALNQTFNSYEVIVSDNSTNNDSQIIISKFDDNRLSYKRRKPSLSVIDHLNAILQDVTSDYFMIFHDDDVMHENMLEVLYYTIGQHKNAVAVGANAIIFKNGISNNKKIFKASKSNLVLSHPKDIVFQYSIRGGIVPFPSYMYKSEIAHKLKFDISKGGKYCDAAFILDSAALGNIIFIVNPLMDYYIHIGQDSNKYAFELESKLIRYFCMKACLDRNSKLIKKLRIRSVYLELKHGLLNKNISVISKRYYKLINILLKSCYVEYFIKSLVISISELYKKLTHQRFWTAD